MSCHVRVDPSFPGEEDGSTKEDVRGPTGSRTTPGLETIRVVLWGQESQVTTVPPPPPQPRRVTSSPFSSSVAPPHAEGCPWGSPKVVEGNNVPTLLLTETFSTVGSGTTGLVGG